MLCVQLVIGWFSAGTASLRLSYVNRATVSQIALVRGSGTVLPPPCLEAPRAGPCFYRLPRMPMDLLSSIKLPHWLMIAGAILIATGFLGLVFARNKEAATNPDSEPPVPRPQLPPLPSLLDSSRHKDNG